MDKEKVFDFIKAAYAAVDEKMGEDIMVLDISEVSPLADYFIIASASNANQLKAMADFVEEKLEKMGMMLRHSEGTQTARWILLDFRYIIVHLFHREEREYYRLEKVWGDAKNIEVSDLT